MKKPTDLPGEKISRTNPRERKYSDYIELLSDIKKNNEFSKDFPSLKIAVLRNFTVEPLLPVLEAEIYLAGFIPNIWVGDFDNIAFEAMSITSGLEEFEPDFILIFNWLDTISPALTTQFILKSKGEIDEEVVRVRQVYRDIEGSLRKSFSVPIAITNFNLPVDSTLGILDSQDSDYQFHTIQNLNLQILLDAKSFADVYILDIAKIFAAEGYLNAFDSRHWQMARAPFTQRAILTICNELGRLFKALRGKSKKCLVLDCDNTLWGGVIGEDGMGGIKLGTTFPGSCYKALQEEVLNLRERGVILALCSKNNESDVLEVLNNHPEMLIKEKHVSTWQINWDDKATNLRRLAKELNIGLDSFVFVDDNEFEINLIREQLPEVATIHLTGNTSGYRSLLSSFGYFDSLTFTAEDRRKNEMYGEAHIRNKLESESSSIEEYLENLGLEAALGIPTISDIARCSQLTQKTNQFNLTTCRYSEGQIAELISDKDSDVFYLRVKDKVADLGLVGVAVVRYRELEAQIEAFMMSCRAIGRGAETALLAYIANQSKSKRGSHSLSAKYLHTAKNESLVRNFYEENGFEKVSQQGEDTNWELDLRTEEISYPAWIKINES
ncbi:HAD-superfamily phosphatase, subfamily IIIC/FkbH-like domain [Polynucleobacter duraquae]|uniref:HAD-superfamily phosphatase, subfamily IIIC/FkbH-like domain n=1 Tax=Polynucleobacter duraquae TaxID=1835254 RepID=A0A0E3ZKK9_9BURK|nr:HAD-IIIC family phosphatase [Polynucleobacter duraquae]AKD24677.1 HAD-superfamily phosphatase, subfamily IIIC/FkbH-like domain [Polynucleobacter duraquae]